MIKYILNVEKNALHGSYILVTFGIKRYFTMKNLRGVAGRLNFILARGGQLKFADYIGRAGLMVSNKLIKHLCPFCYPLSNFLNFTPQLFMLQAQISWFIKCSSVRPLFMKVFNLQPCTNHRNKCLRTGRDG